MEIVPTVAFPPATPSTVQVTVFSTPLIFALYCSFCLKVTEPARGITVTVVAGVAPVPERVKVWRPLGSVSLIVIYPVRAPTAEGEKLTLMTQLAAAARDWGQVLVCAKSPLATILMMSRLLLAAFVRVMLWEVLTVPTFWFPNAKLVTEGESGPTVPVPIRGRDCGLLGSESLISNVAARIPPAFG